MQSRCAVNLSYKPKTLVQRTVGWTVMGAALVALASPVMAQTAPKAPAAAAAAAPEVQGRLP
jgi:hypothetical protein